MNDWMLPARVVTQWDCKCVPSEAIVQTSMRAPCSHRSRINCPNAPLRLPAALRNTVLQALQFLRPPLESTPTGTLTTQKVICTFSVASASSGVRHYASLVRGLPLPRTKRLDRGTAQDGKSACTYTHGQSVDQQGPMTFTDIDVMPCMPETALAQCRETIGQLCEAFLNPSLRRIGTASCTTPSPSGQSLHSMSSEAPPESGVCCLARSFIGFSRMQQNSTYQGALLDFV
ncbi:hypothetical protein L226DRAFT_219902 [Lentinus tigrinus ALCF2SS1-7]|uniref:Uncharacterized protein n=1 Tax=Lentinus tigrinus ALCF2SS1-6 TaxID=1328759 RepID=A0A5C2S851_9APHY|nr:hypothetical protein L227DRAFT_159953 [Lentinus tigrinus ALCF2SS1-6]RPD70778.1 hypothetical protein L226DRAFT_219902 [Lentinus tigrinus ALCF2SS1-7]